MRIKKFLIRFLVHLGLMVGISLIGLKLYYPKTALITLIYIEHDFIWISILAAFFTTVAVQNLSDL
ncbi:MAG: hypothetical protein AB8B59_05880 [Maribacter sp.]